MLQLVPFLWRRLEFASVPCVAVSFWGLAVLVHIKLQGGVIKPLVLGTMLLCCLLVLGFVNLRWWKFLGTPGWLLLASIVSYLFISSATSLATGAELLTKDLLRQVFFFLVTLAALLGGRGLLERIGAERLLKWTLVILVTSCAVVVASPLLRDIGVLPEYRLHYRMTGTFTDPNDAGFIACVTAILALAFQSNGRQRPLACFALVLGCAAGLASFSATAIPVLGGMLILFLLLHFRRLRQDLLHTGLTVLCLVGVLVWLIPGPPVVNTHEARIVDAYYPKWVGDQVSVLLLDNKPHRGDPIPVNSWRWQRADARSGDVDTPDDATWTDIEGALSRDYTLTDEDGGKFLRAWVFYEKNDMACQLPTMVIGPILTGSAVASTDADTPLHVLKAPDETVEAFLGKAERRLLWEMGVNKVLESPITGHGLFQLHHMEGAPLGHHRRPNGVHNVYLMLAGEAGIIPLAIYLLSLFLLMRLLWTAPKSLGRDVVAGGAFVMSLYGLPFHHLLTMGAYNFVIGLACATAAFLIQRQTDPAAA